MAQKPMRDLSEMPGPKGLDTLGMIWRFRQDPLQGLLDLRDRYGDILQYRYGSLHRVLISQPEAAMRVLVDNHPNYNKDSPFYHMLKWFFGDGMLSSDGELWKRQRRLAQPAFSRRKVEALGPMMVSVTEAAMQEWTSEMDAAEALGQLTLQIVGRALFHEDLSEQGQDIGAIAKLYQRQMLDRFRSIYPFPPVLPTPKDQLFRRLRREMLLRIERLVQKRRRGRERPEDLLSSLLDARDEGQAMPEALLCQELMTFLLTGYETVASTLAWTFVLLSRHPDVRRRLEAEIHAVLGERPVGVDDLPNLPLSHRILQETMRLYPPVCVYGRRSIGPDELGGYSIPSRQIVSISPFLLHRHPQIWNNPEGFDPDRFQQEPVRGSFVPFALGPRQCIGGQLAMMELRLILCTVARRWRLNLVSGTRIVPEPLISLQPKYGVQVTLEAVPGHEIVPRVA
jgi:cytochrome P450